jgi:hypothetical protein
MSLQNNIIPKDCSYGCNTRIYWSVVDNAYFEVFTKKKHICPNRVNKPQSNTNSATNIATYYSKKPWNTQTKPKMSNSFELLTGPIETVQTKYERLSDIVTEYGGKVHGSQSHNVANNSLSLIVYYEVPIGQRDEVKQKFDNMIRNNMALQRN